LTKVAVKPRIKVYKKNAELMLEAQEKEFDVYSKLPVTHTTESKYQVVDDFSFMFNRSGVFPLKNGSIVQMTPNSVVNHYTSGYLDGMVVPPVMSAMSDERLLQDALIYYKRVEPFKWEDFEMHDLSKTAFQYIEDCEKTGFINCAVKSLIKEGRL
jgi:hypothetical protein